MPLRLLLVEDDPTSRAFLLAASRALPAEVDVAGSAAAALALATAHAHALWLIDARLPDGSGAALLAQLRALGLRTPALAHTAASGTGELRALRDAGFDAAVAKPLSADAWRAALRAALGLPREAATADADAGAPAPALPLWDDRRALTALNGNAAHVAALRGLFMEELPGVRDAIAAAVDQPDTLAGLLHRLRASCGFVGAARLEAAADALRIAAAPAAALPAFLAIVREMLASPIPS